MTDIYKIITYKKEKNEIDYIKLRKKALNENYENNNFLLKINKVNYKLFLIYNKNIAIGFLWYKRKLQEKTKHNYLILNFYIDSNYQWKWLGIRLYNYVEKKILKENNQVTRLYCKITETNKKSILFFEKTWFKSIWKENYSIYDKKRNKYFWSLLLEKIILFKE